MSEKLAYIINPREHGKILTYTQLKLTSIILKPFLFLKINQNNSGKKNHQSYRKRIT
jgi:hypothetical protein